VTGQPPPSRELLDGRRQHKPRTRQALIDAALSLFGADGYDATSTEQIAESAGVSPRTFFRYFDTKDQVLFFGGDDFNQSVIRQLPDQPAALDDLAALAAAMAALAPSVVPLKPRIRLYFRAIEGSTVLMGKHALATAQHNAATAEALAQRRSLRSPDQQCVLAAAVATVTMERAYQLWLGSRRDLVEIVTESFEVTQTLTCGGARAAAPARPQPG
jgi:AcrR family transcriptional regulator